MGNKLSIKTIVAIGIGAAVFMILGRFGSIPTGIPNTNIETCYAFLALMAILYGPFAGAAIGFIGHALKDLVFYGTPWFSWVIASAVVGLIIGLAWERLKVNEGEFDKKEMIVFNIAIYAEPAKKVYAQGAVASLSNAITVGVLGTILLYTYSKTRVKKGSLDRE